VAHKPTEADARAAYYRYKRTTGDGSATLTITQQGASPTIYELEGEFTIRIYGHASAVLAIDSYCRGYADGKEDCE
jgi:hypothetical protein